MKIFNIRYKLIAIFLIVLFLCIAAQPDLGLRVEAEGIDQVVPANIPPQFDAASNFSEGLAAVQKNGKWGYIDRAGRTAVALQYEGAKDFSEGLAAVKQGGKWGFIDKTGSLVIQPQFVYAQAFSDGFAAIFNVDLDKETGYYGRADYAIDRKGNRIPVSQLKSRKLKEGLKAFYKDGLWGFADEAGNTVIEAKYEDVEDFSEGLAVVAKDGLYGFIDRTGREVLPLRYDGANSFSEGLAGVKQDFIWSFIDKNGNKVIQGEYFAVGGFQGGLAIVKMAGSKRDMYGDAVLQWGLIDRTGRQVVEPKYDDIYPWGEALFKVVVVRNPMFSGYLGEIFGYVDRSGKEVLAPECNFYTSTSEDGIEMIYKGWYNGSNAGLKGLVDLKTGKLITGPAYDEIQGDFHDGLTAAAKKGKWGFLDKAGKEVIGLRYSGASHFSEGVAPVWDKEGVKLIDKTGKVLAVKSRYIEARSAGYGFIAVKDKNNKWGLINKTGKELVRPQYVNLLNFNEYGLARVQTKGGVTGYKYGLIDKTGREVLKPQYDTMYDFGSDGLAMAAKGTAADKLKYGYIDKTGKEVIKLQYDYISDAYQEGMRLIQLNGKYGFLAEPRSTAAPSVK